MTRHLVINAVHTINRHSEKLDAMEGLLFKWTNYINGWQERFFTLRDGIFSYYTSQLEVDTGCKGAFKVTSCDLSVHPTDDCRFEVFIPGEQRYYLRAANSQERQRWIIALGSCKAGITNVQEVQRMQQTEKAIEAKRSELRINRDLLFQQVHGILSVLRATTGANQELEQSVKSLKATCDTVLETVDDLAGLLNPGRPRFRPPRGPSSTSATASPNNGQRPATLPQTFSIADKPTSADLQPSLPPCLPRPKDVALKSPVEIPNGKSSELVERISITPASSANPVVQNHGGAKSASSSSSSSSSNSLPFLSAHLRALRLSRMHSTFFSTMEFSFEDLILSQDDGLTANRLMAVELLASVRSTLAIFKALLPANNPDLSQLGSLQTVYAYMLDNVECIELAVRNINAEDPFQISLEDVVESNSNASIANQDSAYRALLWLARGLNYACIFLKILYDDDDRDSQKAAVNAYNKAFLEFHDWTVRGTATVIIKAVPSFERINNALLLIDASTGPLVLTPPPEALAQLQLDAERFVKALQKCLVAIHAMFLRRGLDPVFCVASAQ